MQELTLRSTQLASSTFDFFSIFFASGLMYLVLTGAVSRDPARRRTLARPRPPRDREPLRAAAALASRAVGAGAGRRQTGSQRARATR